MANGIIDTLKNYYNVATGSGLHEQAMREYLDPFTGGQTYQISEGPVAEYMSNYLKDYTKPDNKVAQAFSEGRRGPGQMRVVGLGESPNPFSVSGIAKAAEMAENPSFQAENLFGEGTLTKVPGGYDYTGGKFDFAADNPVTNFLQDKVFKPSEYVMKFDENFKPLEKFDRDFRNFDQARMGKDILRDILEDDDLDAYSESELMPSDTTKKEGILKTGLAIDNKSRIQTVDKNRNLNYYNLIKSFEKLTQVPILINTSLNLPEEVLVETMNDLKELFKTSKLKYIYFPEINKLIKK